jgi:hypothetical protein
MNDTILYERRSDYDSAGHKANVTVRNDHQNEPGENKSQKVPSKKVG